jgi:hypothetical protein
MKVLVLNSTNPLPKTDQFVKKMKKVQTKFVEHEKRKVDTLNKAFTFMKKQGQEDLQYFRDIYSELTVDEHPKVEVVLNDEDEDAFFE